MAAQTSVEFTPVGPVVDLPLFPGLAIEDWRILRDHPSKIPGVSKIVTSLVTMSDKSSYINRDIYPEEQVSDAEIEIETALGTRVSGANTGWGEEACVATKAKVSIFGSNQNNRVPTSHAQDVWAASVVNTTEVTERGRKPGQGPRILWGKSMGGNANNGKLAYARFFGLEIDFALNEDPSLAHATSFRETAQALTARDLFQEGKEFAPELLRQRGESLKQYVHRVAKMQGTIGISPQFVRAHWNAGRGIWHGDAGMFLPHIPHDQAMVTVMMNLNRLNHRAEYGYHQDPMPNAYIIDRPYKHLAVGCRFMINAGVEALQASTAMLDAGKSSADVAQHVANLLELRLPKREK